jgi:hypothetical protein
VRSVIRGPSDGGALRSARWPNGSDFFAPQPRERVESCRVSLSIGTTAASAEAWESPRRADSSRNNRARPRSNAAARSADYVLRRPISQIRVIEGNRLSAPAKLRAELIVSRQNHADADYH